MFAFDPEHGAVTVRVAIEGMALSRDNIEIVNKTIPGLQVSFENGQMMVTCTKANEQILIRQKNDFADQLLLFLDHIEESEIPEDAQVVRFDAGSSPHIQTAEYDRLTVPNDIDVIYLEAGAVFMGTIHTDDGRNKPLKLMGRGIILGNGPVVHGGTGIPWNAIELNDGTGHLIEGITCISPRHFTIRASADAVIDNVKMFGYDANIDGVVVGARSVIKNCYFKVNDDHVKLYNDDMVVRDCNFYMQRNGAIFQLAWNSITPGNNCLVEKCEVLAWEAGTGDPALNQGGIARTILSLRETDAGSSSSNIKLKDLYIAPKLSRFIGINAKYGQSAPYTLKGVVFENVTLEQVPDKESWIYTGDSPWEVDITFNDVTIAGECLTSSNYHIKTEGNVNLTYSNCQKEDTQAPSKPIDLEVTPTGKDGLGLEWSPSSDDRAIDHYNVWVDDALYFTSYEERASIAGLNCETDYSLRIEAVDQAGNTSESSDPVSTTTGSCTLVLSTWHVAPMVYPNPVQETLFLASAKNWQLRTVSGKLLSTGQSDQINMSLFENGMYILSLNERPVRVLKR